MNIRFMHYYCNNRYQFLLDMIAKSMGIELIKNMQITDIREFTQNARNLNHVDCIAIDVSIFEENEDDAIIDGIIALYNICNAKIIVIAVEKDMEFINKLQKNSISNVLYAEDDIFDKLEKMLTSEDDIEISSVDDERVIQNVLKEEREKAKQSQPISSIINNVVKKAPVITSKRKLRPIRNTTTIAFCNNKSGRGCTHHAIGLVKYLTELGYKACYVEANSSDIITDLTFDGRMSVVKNKYYKYDKRIIMYPMRALVKDIMEEKYQFIVFDYGLDENVPEKDFWTKDMRVIVVGNKMWELEKLHLCLKDGEYSNCKIIMNLTPEIYRKDILDSYDCELFFGEYAPDVFFDNENDVLYENIIKDMLTELE